MIAFKCWSLYASHVTGSTSAIAFRLEGYHQGEYGSETLKEACSLVFSFLVGAYTCGILIDKNQVHFLGKLCFINFTRLLVKMVGCFSSDLSWEEDHRLTDDCTVHTVAHDSIFAELAQRKAFYGLALVLNSALLVSAAFVPGRLLAASLVAAACGLQNAMCTSHFGTIIRTTHAARPELSKFAHFAPHEANLRVV